jgi:hypothetical protein
MAEVEVESDEADEKDDLDDEAVEGVALPLVLEAWTMLVSVEMGSVEGGKRDSAIESNSEDAEWVDEMHACASMSVWNDEAASKSVVRGSDTRRWGDGRRGSVFDVGDTQEVEDMPRSTMRNARVGIGDVRC